MCSRSSVSLGELCYNEIFARTYQASTWLHQAYLAVPIGLVQ
jgi:hypothetical protein